MEQLHAGGFDESEVDGAIFRGNVGAMGAVVMGRRLFDIVDDSDGWSEEVGYDTYLFAMKAYRNRI